MTKTGRALLRVIGFAKMMKFIPTIADPMHSPVKGALLGFTLPSTLILSLVAVLDDGLAAYIEDSNLPWPSEKRPSLSSRINVVSEHLTEMNSARLHEIRKLRNSVAHLGEPGKVQVTWDELEEIAEEIVESFVAMEFLENSPRLDVFYERHPTLYPDELGPEGEIIRHRHLIGVKIDEVIFMEYQHEVGYMPLSS